MHETALMASPGQPHLLQGQTTQLIGILMNLAENHSTGAGTAAKRIKEWVHPWKRLARSELEKTFPKMLTIDAFASALKVAPSTLTHKYRTLCGETFKDTVQSWRMEKTIALLHRKDISIKEIATRLGMAHASHLTAFVKKHTGHSPSELRRMSQSQID
jgi:AraC-like DNA-binding protein